METIAENSVLLNFNDGDATVTTSEAFIYYIWLTAENDWHTGDFSDFKIAWNLLDTILIPLQDNQPSVSTENYNPQSPAKYASKEESPSEYPVALSTSTPADVDPLNDELATVYDSSSTTLNFCHPTHWLMDVDNLYGFGDQESRNKNDTNVFINAFQRRSNEIPEWEIEQYDDPCGGGFQQIFT